MIHPVASRTLPGLFVAGLLVAAACSPRAAPAPEAVSIPASSLAGAIVANADRQPAIVLLPPDYATTTRDYPTVYYLPGFATSITEYFDGTFGDFHFGTAVREAMTTGSVADFVVVIVNGRNALGGSFYVNSPVTGAWEDYVAVDVVRFVEDRYRVRRSAAWRGVAGEGMGGAGALGLAMRRPDVFGSAFALSPTLFDERGPEDAGFLGAPYRKAFALERETMRSGAGDAATFASLVGELHAAGGRFNWWRAYAYAYAAAFAPEPAAGPPYAALPFGDGAAADSASIARLRAGLGDLAAKVRERDAALRSLRGLGLDVGRNDRLAWPSRGARRLSELLTAAGIRHEITEHDGGHDDRLGERIEQVLLPFFSRVFAENAAGSGS